MVCRYDVESLVLSIMMEINTLIQISCEREGVICVDFWYIKHASDPPTQCRIGKAWQCHMKSLEGRKGLHDKNRGNQYIVTPEGNSIQVRSDQWTKKLQELWVRLRRYVGMASSKGKASDIKFREVLHHRRVI